MDMFSLVRVAFCRDSICSFYFYYSSVSHTFLLQSLIDIYFGQNQLFCMIPTNGQMDRQSILQKRENAFKDMEGQKILIIQLIVVMKKPI